MLCLIFTEIVSYGPPSMECQFCKAKLWFEERVEKFKRINDVKFTLCCQKGKVKLPFLQGPPQLLMSLMFGKDERSNHYKENIRAYNNMFSFTSIGGKIQSLITDSSGPPQFILTGQNYHRIGSLLPEDGCQPKFAQLYIYDTQNEVHNRIKKFWVCFLILFLFQN